MELLNAWMLWQSTTDNRLPNCVYFEYNKDGRCFCVQYRCDADYRTATRGAVGLPVCVVSRSVESMREIWARFIEDGWTRVDAATPQGCSYANAALDALAHRRKIATDQHSGVDGSYAPLGRESDLYSDLYFKNKLPTPDGFHAVKGMPLYPSVPSHQGKHTAAPTPRPVAFPDPAQQIAEIFRQAMEEEREKYESDYLGNNTNYALEA